METKKTNTVQSSIKTHDHPYLKDAWVPNYEEYEVTDLNALGDIPEDIEGAYYRNTENQVHEPIGRFHPFDGCLLYTSPSPRDATLSRMPSSA